jgi:hypothetical protein
LARAHSVYIVQLNHNVIAAATVKHELETWLDRHFPKCPTNLRVLRVSDTMRWTDKEQRITDITSAIYGLED